MTAARAVSREMRDEVDEVWRPWNLRATAENDSDDSDVKSSISIRQVG